MKILLHTWSARRYDGDCLLGFDRLAQNSFISSFMFATETQQTIGPPPPLFCEPPTMTFEDMRFPERIKAYFFGVMIEIKMHTAFLV